MKCKTRGALPHEIKKKYERRISLFKTIYTKKKINTKSTSLPAKKNKILELVLIYFSNVEWVKDEKPNTCE